MEEGNNQECHGHMQRNMNGQVAFMYIRVNECKGMKQQGNIKLGGINIERKREEQKGAKRDMESGTGMGKGRDIDRKRER
jgi:hypothetical protein